MTVTTQPRSRASRLATAGGANSLLGLVGSLGASDRPGPPGDHRLHRLTGVPHRPNIRAVLVDSSILMIIAIGQSFVMSTSGIDLSVSAVAQLSGVVLGAVAVGAGLPIGIGILIALAVGALAGALNGLIIARGKVGDFIVTLGTFGAFTGLTLLISQAQPQILGSAFLIRLATGGAGILTHLLLIALVIAGVAWVLLFYTPFGTHVLAVGGNKGAADADGLSFNRIKVAVYAISGFLAAVGGILLAARLGVAADRRRRVPAPVGRRGCPRRGEPIRRQEQHLRPRHRRGDPHRDPQHPQHHRGRPVLPAHRGRRGRRGIRDPAEVRELMTTPTTSRDGEHLLDIADLRLQFGNVTALGGATMHARQGEVTAIIGDNGAGKSSLVKCVLGVNRPTSGSMRFRGEEVTVTSPHHAKELGIEAVFGRQDRVRAARIFMGFDDELADRQRRTVSGKQFLECYSSDQPTRAVAKHNFVAACARIEVNDFDGLAVVGQLGADGETDSLGGHDDASMTCCGVNNASMSTRTPGATTDEAARRGPAGQPSPDGRRRPRRESDRSGQLRAARRAEQGPSTSRVGSQRGTGCCSRAAPEVREQPRIANPSTRQHASSTPTWTQLLGGPTSPEA